MLSPIWNAALAGLAIFFVISWFVNRNRSKANTSAFEQRLRHFQQQSSLVDEQMYAEDLQTRTGFVSAWAGFGRSLSGLFLSGRSGQSWLESLEQQLVLAGNPNGWKALDFIGFFVATIGGWIVVGGLLVRAGFPAVLYLLVTVGLLFVPRYMLKTNKSNRQLQAFSELPYFIDQMILGLSSGAVTLDSALRQIVLDDDELGVATSKRVLVTEFRRAYLEQANHVRPMADAFRAAAARIDVQHVDDLVEAIIEGYTSGTPMLHVLRNMSNHIYQLFEQEMYSLIKKKDTPFTVATVIIMFSTAVIIGEPIVSNVVRALRGHSGL